MSRGGCPVARFARALAQSAASAGAPISIETHRAAPWHSLTFAGHRHEVEATAQPGDPLDRWLATLPALDLPLRDELLAELRVDACARTVDAARFRLAGLTVAR